MPFLIFILLLLSNASDIVASEKEEILWVKWKLVPEYIESGKFKDLGYLDHFLRYVQQELPEYKHRDEFQTLNRISLSWQQGNVCSLHLWLGYWPGKIIYSEPYAFTPRFGIVTNKSSKLAKQFINNRNEVSVVYLDRLRVDYIIRQRITHFAELKNDEKQDNYKFYFLDEGRRHKLVASACSNSELGREVIGKINALINEDFHRRYLDFRRQWDNNNPTFDKTFIDYFINKKPVDYVTE